MALKPAIHGRDHCPGGADPIPCLEGSTVPWILLRAGGQALPGDAVFDPFLFDELSWDPNLVALNPADVTDGSDDNFHVDIATFGGTDYFRFFTKTSNGNSAWFRFEIFAGLDDTGDGAPGVFWEVDVLPTASGGAFPGVDGTTWAHIWNGTEYFLPVMRHSFEIHANDQRGYDLQSRQNTGVDKGLGGFMFIQYLGTLGGSATDDDWEFVIP